MLYNTIEHLHGFLKFTATLNVTDISSRIIFVYILSKFIADFAMTL